MPTEFCKYIYTVNWRDKNKLIRICLLETGLVKQIEEMKRTDETTLKILLEDSSTAETATEWCSMK